ncbi:MAG TPA: hypothetical protein VIY08_03955 [Candidatus Nitrosocosmicus sp.]
MNLTQKKLVYIVFKKIIFQIIPIIILFNIFQFQKCFPYNPPLINNTTNSILSGYINCFVDYKTSICNDCPPSCLSINSTVIAINDKKLSHHLDSVFEKSLRQISSVKSGSKNETYLADIYLHSLLLKNEIKIIEFNLINNLISEIQNSKSLLSLGKDVHDKLKLLENDNNSSSISIAIVNILSKSIDLLINSDHLLYNIHGYTDLKNDLTVQKKWMTKIMINTIIGCEISGLSGCLVSSIFSSDIS